MFEKVTAEHLADILDIDLVSAEEMLRGVIEFEVNELILISKFYGITLDELVLYLNLDLKRK